MHCTDPVCDADTQVRLALLLLTQGSVQVGHNSRFVRHATHMQTHCRLPEEELSTVLGLPGMGGLSPTSITAPHVPAGGRGLYRLT
jgi:hypothetical protein